MKLYLVWNEAKTECVGFNNLSDQMWAIGQPIGWEFIQPSALSDAWREIHDGEQCTITEIEV